MKNGHLKMFFGRAGERKEMIQKVVMKGYDSRLSISIIESRSPLDGYEVAKDYIFGRGEYMTPHLDGRVELTITFWLPEVDVDCRPEVTITLVAGPNNDYLVPVKIEYGGQELNVQLYK